MQYIPIIKNNQCKLISGQCKGQKAQTHCNLRSFHSGQVVSLYYCLTQCDEKQVIIAYNQLITVAKKTLYLGSEKLLGMVKVH